MKKYYSLEQENREATLQIYGEITSWPWLESDVSAYLLSKQIEGLDVDTLHVYLNSYGGEVAEGWAIYNALRRHPAQVHTYADGFVCSIASVIFMAGDIRTMSDVSALMIHQPSTLASGNAADMRKTAEELDTLGELSAKAHLRYVSIGEDELRAMLDAETWIVPEDAVQMGFATDIAAAQESGGVTQSFRRQAFDRMTRNTAPIPSAAAIHELNCEEISNKIYRLFEEKVSALMQETLPQKRDLMKFLNVL